MLRKLYRPKVTVHWDILEKETVDEIIFRTTNPRNRLLLELMARGGMRIGEVLKLTPRDVHDRKLIIRDPKSDMNKKSFLFRKKLPIVSKNIFVLIKSIHMKGYFQFVTRPPGQL